MKKIKLKLDYEQAFCICHLLFYQVVSAPAKFNTNQEKILCSLLIEAHQIFMRKSEWNYSGQRTYSFTVAQSLALREAIEGGWLKTENTWMLNVLTINHLRLHKLTA